MRLAIISLLFACALSAQGLVPIQAGRDMSSLRNGLVGWWKMDEGNLGTVATDSSGTGNTGTWGSTKLGTWGFYSSGKVGPWSGAFMIPPGGSVIGSVVIAADNASLQFGTGDFSISSWIYPFVTSYGASNQGTVVSKGNVTGFECLIYQGHVSYYVGNVASNGTIAVSPGNWYQITFTRKAGVTASYVNGVLDNTITLANSVSGVGTSVVWGVRPGSSINYYFGLIDDGRLYNRALSAKEVQQLYSSGSAAVPLSVRAPLIANTVITNNHFLFSDGTDGWAAAPFYGTTTNYLDDLTLAMIGNAPAFTAPQIANILTSTIAAKNGNGDFPGALSFTKTAIGFTDPCNTLNASISPDVAMNLPLMEKIYYNASGSTARFSADAAALKTALTNGTIQFSGAGLLTVPSGIGSGTYVSGGTITGTVGQTINLALGGVGSGATATVALTGVNTIAGGTALVISTAGTGYTANPSTSTCSNGTATCTGTVTITGVSQIYTPWAGMDGVLFTGDNMYGNAHYYDAVSRMAELYTLIGDSTNATWASTQASNISSNITASLWDATDGMFYASSGTNRQIDILGSSYASAIGLATPTQKTAISDYLNTNYAALVNKGMVRQSPTNWATSWGGNQCGRGTGNYDDGYWGYGLGYIASALAYAHPTKAVQLVNDAVLGQSTLENIGASATGATSNMMSPQGLVKFVNDNPGLFH